MSKIIHLNGSCAQDAAGIGVADQCRHLLRSARRQRALARRRRASTGSDQRHEECVDRGGFSWSTDLSRRGGGTDPFRRKEGYEPVPLGAGGVKTGPLYGPEETVEETVEESGLYPPPLQTGPVTFSSNFGVAMSEQLCSNPWRNNFVEGKIWDHPSKMTQERPGVRQAEELQPRSRRLPLAIRQSLYGICPKTHFSSFFRFSIYRWFQRREGFILYKQTSPFVLHESVLHECIPPL